MSQGAHDADSPSDGGTDSRRDNVRHLHGLRPEAAILDLEGPELAVAMYDRFGGDVNRVVGSLLGPDPDHDDLVQRVFAVALAKIGKLRDRSSLRGWLVSIAANTTRTELRRRQRWQFWSLSSEAPEVGEVTEDYDARELLDTFYAVVGRLPADERIVFIFRYVDDRPLAEVAALCGCSLATVKRRLTRASQRFLRHAKNNPDLMTRIQRGETWGAKS